MADTAIPLPEDSLAAAPETQAAPPLIRPKSPERTARLLQFPRRILFLLISFGLFVGVISLLRSGMANGVSQRLPGTIDWSISLRMHIPVADIITERLPNSLILLGTSLVLAAILGVIAGLFAIALQWLQEKINWLGYSLRILCAQPFLIQAGTPVAVLGMILLFFVAFQYRLLPVYGMYSPDQAKTFEEVLKHLVLPSLTLSILPAVWMGQAVKRTIVQNWGHRKIRAWLAGLLVIPGALFQQTGGLLTALIIVETVFAWPGIGRLFYESYLTLDLPLFLGLVMPFGILILTSRLVVELLSWTKRLILAGESTEPTPARKNSLQTVLTIAALLTLIIPIGLAAGGFFISSEQTNQTSIDERFEEPSSEHLLGTDEIGRDIAARLVKGASNSILISLLASLILLIPSALFGGASAWFARRKSFGYETLSDVILLFTDAFLFFPALVLCLILLAHFEMNGPGISWFSIVLVIAAALLPRSIRAFQSLWKGTDKLSARQIISSLAGFLLSGWAFSFLLVIGIDFLGVGLRPPTAALGSELGQFLQWLRELSVGMLVVALTTALIGWVLVICSDALTKHTQDGLGVWNE